MGLADDAEKLGRHFLDSKTLLQHNSDLFTIFEGELLPFVFRALQEQLGVQSFEAAKKRISPINVLTKIIDKLSKIYQQEPLRMVLDGSDTDDENLRFYEKKYKANETLNNSNEFLNLFKNTLLEPFVSQGVPRLRAVPSDSFLVWSNDPIDRTRVTHVIKIFGKKRNRRNEVIDVLFVYTDEEFAIIDSEGNVLRDEMSKLEGPVSVGENPIGRIPFVYVNKSQNLLIPKPDTDTMAMTVLLPLLLSDLNYASMFQTFSIMYGIDVDNEGLVMAPNAFWELRSDPTRETKPDLGTLKPEVDIDKVLTLIQSQIALWLNTRGIRPGAVGQLNSENFASGVSKMIDEMDTFEAREKQVNIFKNAEEELWDLTFNFLHPHWIATGQIDPRPLWSSPQARVLTNFHEQLPLVRRGQLVADLRAEVEAGFIPRERAIAKLNPRMTEDQIEELIEEMGVGPAIEGETALAEGVDAGIAAEGTGPEIDPTAALAPKEVLNGAQVTAIVDVIEKVSSGLIPRESGINILVVAFGLSPQEAEQVIGRAGGSFVPTQEGSKGTPKIEI